jgi:16S rRNA (cytidine1402-2'-O)-methyltransferase
MLYLIATPLGNLQDITYRSVEMLKKCDLLLCEDTRRTSILLKHYSISCPLHSFHKFSERRKEDIVIAKLKEGLTIGLVSDAGTPCISDPGYRLVKRCIEEGIALSSLPGPTACILALTLSGFSAERFQFLGFFPKTPGKVKKVLQEMLLYPGPSIAYVSPYQVLKVLGYLAEINKEVQVAIAREMTKIHEEVLRGTAEEVLKNLAQKEPRGEFVFMLSPEGF